VRTRLTILIESLDSLYIVAWPDASPPGRASRERFASLGSREPPHPEEEKMRAALTLILVTLALTVLNCTMEDSARDITTTMTTTTTQELLAVCGDNICTPGAEDCGTCPGDCPCGSGFTCSNRVCVPVCGDGVCSPGAEDCGTCPVDCPCPGGLTCRNRQCVSDPCDGDPCCQRPHLCCSVPAADGTTTLVICP
jgi:hypothetical protein